MLSRMHLSSVLRLAQARVEPETFFPADCQKAPKRAIPRKTASKVRFCEKKCDFAFCPLPAQGPIRVHSRPFAVHPQKKHLESSSKVVKSRHPFGKAAKTPRKAELLPVIPAHPPLLPSFASVVLWLIQPARRRRGNLVGTRGIRSQPAVGPRPWIPSGPRLSTRLRLHQSAPCLSRAAQE